VATNQAIVRGYNFFVVAFLGILGGSLISELSQETEWLFRVDELLIIAIAAAAIVWYRIGKNRITRSIVPVLLPFAALVVKVFGMIAEINDPADVGDDIAIVQTLILLVVVSVVAYIRLPRTGLVVDHDQLIGTTQLQPRRDTETATPR
jgi:hypothetical protein